MIDKGQMIEYGTFTQLMAKKGHMAKLLSDNVRIGHEAEELIEKNLETNLHLLNNRRSSNDADDSPNLTRRHQSALKPLSSNLESPRLSVVSLSDSVDVVIPSDAEPMKLVLEDQSVNYQVSPSWLYLKAGWGVVITLLVYAFFFIVYIFRILSGRYFQNCFLILKTLKVVINILKRNCYLR